MDETNGTKLYRKMKCLDASKAKKMNAFVKGIDGAIQ